MKKKRLLPLAILAVLVLAALTYTRPMTLEAMVRGAACADGVYCACMDARKGQIYNALFNWTDGALLRRTEDRAIAISELSQELKNIPGARSARSLPTMSRSPG